jgi:type III secretion protein U
MSGEKTERPTDHRLRQAREEGQVCKSKDLTQTLLLGALFGYTFAAAGDIVKLFADLMVAPAKAYGTSFRGAAAFMIAQAVDSLLRLLLPYLLIVVVVGVLAETMQSGFLFAPKALKVDAEKLNPVTNLKQMFSMKNIVEFLKSNLKVIFLSALVAIVIRDSLDAMLKIPAAGIEAVGLAMIDMMTVLIACTFIAYGAIAIFDFAYQRHSYIKGLMMSMEEIKQEHKQLEGDPHVKSHRRHLAQEIAMGEVEQRTRKSSAVITNPTHLAVAIYYEEGLTPLPIVMTKGEDLVAHRMVRVARDAGVPVMQNIPLARALMATEDIDQYIPAELVEPVAEVLRALRRLAEQRPERDA